MDRRLRIGRRLLSGLLALGVFTGTPLQAQSEPQVHIGFIAHSRLPARMRNAVMRALRTRYDVTRLGTGRERRPVAALRKRIQAAEVNLVLLVSKQRNMLKLEFHDAQSGERLGMDRLYVRGSELSPRVEDKVLAKTGEYVALVAGLAHDPGRRDTAVEQAAPVESKSDGESEFSDEATSHSEPFHESAGDDEAAEQASERPPGEELPDASTLGAGGEDRVELTVVAGMGTSTQSADFRSDGLSSRFDAGIAMAAGVGARLAIGSREKVHFWAESRYATSLGRTVDELHMGGAPQPMGLRTHRLEGGFGPRVPLGDRGWLLTPTLGYALRSVAPEVHFQLIPFYTLGGPYLRFELTTPLFGPGIGLRLSPEVQWLPQASAKAGGSRLAARFALAGQLVLFVRLSEAVDLEAFVHESHAWANTSGLEVKDMERFVLANIAWRP